MRTTIVIDDRLQTQIKRFVPARKLSEFINHCVREYLVRRAAADRLKQLEKSYQRAAKKSDKKSDPSEIEGWPVW